MAFTSTPLDFEDFQYQGRLHGNAGPSAHGLVMCITKLRGSPASDKELEVVAPHFNLIASLNTDA
jgi:hypothetical protein